MTVASIAAVRRDGVSAPIFAATALGSAALVFTVEPMIAKMILPLLGGSPAVWNACMAFFQSALLAGYLYAHLLQRLRAVSTQVALHLFLLSAASLALPLGVTAAFGAPPVEAPVGWLLCVLTVSIGAPFAVLSASAPLLQAWYVRAEEARNPYILYVASNLGSMAGLVAYPTLIEPSLSVHAQSRIWSFAYFGFCALVATVGALVWRRAAAPAAATSPHVMRAVDAPTWRKRVLWLLLAAAPSSLMLGATTYISDDVASVPFLWVIPLALYLLTFIIAFQARPLISQERALLWQAVFVSMAAGLFCINTGSLLVHAFVYAGAFFFTALVCHLKLAETRPAPLHLTEFYLLLSLGGVIGGMFNALLAPAIFSGVAEFPLVLAASLLARPWTRATPSWRMTGIALFGLCAAAALALIPNTTHTLYVTVALAIAGGAAAGAVSTRTALFALVVGALCIETVLVPPDKYATLSASRSFFGVYRVTAGRDPVLGPMHLMFHGTTVHGAQSLEPSERCRPTTYYAKATPLGQVLGQVLSRPAAGNIGVVGLGVGTVATYLRAGDRMRFFEIDPEVERIARDPRRFRYLGDCAKGRVDVMLGDARLTLARERKASYDVIMLDAFSADTVPTHLLTVEAFRLYLSLLKPDGLLVLHLSNRNLALEAPAAAGAKDVGATALMQLFSLPKGQESFAQSATHAMLIAKSPAALAAFVRDKRWRPARDRGVPAWSDDYTNVFGALVDRMRGF